MHLIVNNIFKRSGKTPVLKGINLDLRAGDLTVLLGPKHSGKTELLRIIAGIDSADSGDIFIEGEKISHLKVRDRRIGMVFDKPYFFPNLNIYKNLRLVLDTKKRSDTSVEDRIRATTEGLGFAHLLMAMPDELTAYQLFIAQLARALLNEPTLVLIDDPFDQIDSADYNQVRLLLKSQITNKGHTMLVATRYSDQAQLLANRLAVIDQGVIQQIDSPDRIYRYPTSMHVANTIYTQGFNILPARIKRRLKTAINCLLCGISEAKVNVSAEKMIEYDRDSVYVCLLPHSFGFEEDPDKKQSIRARLLEVESTESYICSHWYVDQDTVLEVHSNKPPKVQPGASSDVFFNQKDAFVYSDSNLLLSN